MTDYIPTTEQVRTEWVESGSGSPTNRLHAGAAFDRWLAKHDAEIRAQAAQEVRDFTAGLLNGIASLPSGDPYNDGIRDAIAEVTASLPKLARLIDGGAA